MSVESGRAEIVVFPQRLERLSVGDQELHGADIAVVGAPLKNRYAVFIRRGRRVTRRDVIEYQVCAPFCNLIKYAFVHIAMCEERSLRPFTSDGINVSTREFKSMLHGVDIAHIHGPINKPTFLVEQVCRRTG